MVREEGAENAVQSRARGVIRDDSLLPVFKLILVVHRHKMKE
jgi:hypothetical protein